MDTQDPKTRRIIILLLMTAFLAYWTSVPENRQGVSRHDLGDDLPSRREVRSQADTFPPLDPVGESWTD